LDAVAGEIGRADDHGAIGGTSVKRRYLLFRLAQGGRRGKRLGHSFSMQDLASQFQTSRSSLLSSRKIPGQEPILTATGQGTMTFALPLGDSTNVSLADITSFAFAYTETDPPEFTGMSNPYTYTVIFSTLQILTLVLGPDGLPTYADFVTNPYGFNVQTDSQGDIYAVNIPNLVGYVVFTNATSSVPECGTLAMLGIGLTLIGLLAAKRARILTAPPERAYIEI
jgi:hypothetical protein